MTATINDGEAGDRGQVLRRLQAPQDLTTHISQDLLRAGSVTRVAALVTTHRRWRGGSTIITPCCVGRCWRVSTRRMPPSTS